MSAKKIVLKVSIASQQCKTNAMKAAANLCGIKSLTLDAEKNTLTVVGGVDVVCLVSALRKAKVDAEVVSVGPEEVKKEEKKDDKKKPAEEPKPCKPCEPPRPCCGCAACCSQTAHGNLVVVEEEQPYGCTIL